MERKLFKGNIVELKVFCMSNPAGARGVVYEEYDIGSGPGVGVIFQNGNMDGFSIIEQDYFVSKVGHSPVVASYEFKNMMTLCRDFESGRFNDVFSPESNIERDRRTIG